MLTRSVHLMTLMCEPWQLWEDWIAGMYVTTATAEHEAASLELLTDPDQFREVAREMVRCWPVSAHHNLVNMWTGRRAWIGQASCLYSVNSPGVGTRAAWGRMTLEEQRAANVTADDVLEEWKRNNVGQTLFDY